MRASTLAIAVAETVITPAYASDPQLRSKALKQVAERVDERLAAIRAAYEPEELARCPIVSHHPDPCAFCITAAMRAFILLTEEL